MCKWRSAMTRAMSHRHRTIDKNLSYKIYWRHDQARFTHVESIRDQLLKTGLGKKFKDEARANTPTLPPPRPHHSKPAHPREIR